ncbi:hypothetical protein [Antrihabitans sp. YC2-6]|uniref:hypothetical protein n=1 Tax=Antrihabitans sp. YC2-6 TaxID=2799498 RepID=UPI0018F2801A|nr:hypothetical protein [Antrihabitans sp. YC2-6]MBJ8346148.1 hypothetical protein [Antrihabitans sp. YC2-6]
MYAWLWRVIPGGPAVKSATFLVLFLGIAALLFLFVFPYVDGLMPFDNVTVDR